MLPNFFIIGANKAGTTSLHAYLSEHPEIFMSRVKEPMYFTFKNATETEKAQHAESVNTWMKFTAYTLPEYEALFSGSENYKARGEASTSYFCDPAAAMEIRKLIPEAKIIALLREPVSRAMSNYRMYVGWGIEEKNFEQCVLEELSGKRVRRAGCTNYLDLGLYSGFLKSYLDTFPADHVRLFLFEDFTGHPDKILQEICRFLGVDPGFKFNTSYVHNKSGGPAKDSAPGRSGLLDKMTPGFLRKAITGKPAGANPYKLLTSHTVIRKLKEYYKEDLDRLESLIGRDLSHWKNKKSWP